MEKQVPPKFLILATLAILVLVSIGTAYLSKSTLPAAIEIDTTGQPTIGHPKAKVHVVAFEEPKCVECKIFNNTIFPKLKNDYIATGKIKYTMIPVSFLPDSMPAAVSLLCVYHQDLDAPNDDLFFDYMDYMYLHQPSEHIDWATVAKLQELAKAASPAINSEKIKHCVEHEAYRKLIVKNTDYARTIMGGNLGTPQVYVDGIPVVELDYDDLADLIDKVLKDKGSF
jgi:protein-disulfide isomerase